MYVNVCLCIMGGVKFIEMGSRVVVTMGWGRGRGGGSYYVTGTEIQLYKMKRVPASDGGDGCSMK